MPQAQAIQRKPSTAVQVAGKAAAALPALTKTQMQIAGQMLPGLRDVAMELLGAIADRGAKSVLGDFDIGARIRVITDNVEMFGNKSVTQLATFLNFEGGASRLYAFRTFATEFDRDFVTAKSRTITKSGRLLTTQHWLGLTKLKDARDRRRLLDQAIADGWSAKELAHEVSLLDPSKRRLTKSGGRSQQVSPNPMVNVAKTLEMTAKFNRWAESVDTAIFSPLDEAAPAQVNVPMIEKIRQLKDQLNLQAAHSQRMVGRLEAAESRLRRMLSRATARPATEDEDAETIDDESED